MATIKVANTAKDAGSESGADLQKIIADCEPPDPSKKTRKKMKSDLMKTHDLTSKTHGIQIQTFKSVSSAGKKAKTLKDAGAGSDEDLHKIIVKFKPSDPIVSSRKEKNSVLKNLLMAFGTQLEPTSYLLKSK